MQGLFEHIGLNLTLEDYQRLGPLKPDDTGSTMVRLQFWSKDDKSLLFAKFKEFSQDEQVKKVSLINDYPLFQLADVKRLSNEAYAIRQKDILFLYLKLYLFIYLFDQHSILNVYVNVIMILLKTILI